MASHVLQAWTDLADFACDAGLHSHTSTPRYEGCGWLFSQLMCLSRSAGQDNVHSMPPRCPVVNRPCPHMAAAVQGSGAHVWAGDQAVHQCPCTGAACNPAIACSSRENAPSGQGKGRTILSERVLCQHAQGIQRAYTALPSHVARPVAQVWHACRRCCKPTGAAGQAWKGRRACKSRLCAWPARLWRLPAAC